LTFSFEKSLEGTLFEGTTYPMESNAVVIASTSCKHVFWDFKEVFLETLKIFFVFSETLKGSKIKYSRTYLDSADKYVSIRWLKCTLSYSTERINISKSSKFNSSTIVFTNSPFFPNKFYVLLYCKVSKTSITKGWQRKDYTMTYFRLSTNKIEKVLKQYNRIVK